MPLYPAADADLESIAALVNHAYRGEDGWTHEGEFLGGPRTDAATLRRDLAASVRARLMVLRDDSDREALGVVWLEPATETAWYLGMLTVRPDLQDRQLGRALLTAAEALVVSWGGSSVQMTVLNLRTPLIAWYERRGYRRTGEIQPFPYQDERFGKPLRDDLAFVVLEKGVSAAAASAAA